MAETLDTADRTDPSARREALAGLALDKGAVFAPKRRSRFGAGRLMLLAIVVVGIAAWLWRSASAAPAVQVGTVLKRSPIVDAEITTANGYVRARTRASLASKTQGRLAKVLVDEGDLVTAGQLLAVVEHDEADAGLVAAQARIAAAQREVAVADAAIDEALAAQASAKALLAEREAGRDAAQAELAQANAGFRRIEDLVTREIRSEADLDSAREARDVAQAQVRRADAAVATAQKDIARADAARATAQYQREASAARVAIEEAERQRIEVQRAQSFITAPFAGVVLRREAEPGEVVSPANTGASGSKTAVVTLADFATLEVEVDVYERDIARISAGAPCRVVLDSRTDRRLEASVRLVRPTADRTRSTVQVYVAFAAVPEFARPEMVARVTFYRPQTAVLTDDELIVPGAAVTSRGGQDGVFVVAGQTARFRALRLGEARSGDRLVLDGLVAGESVVLSPADSLNDGDAIAVSGR
ncbi:MAG: efflux RND transporter periplasmic adaptor subunit [Planctomycetes bacterium]|nr:efflux RND transporter periplasmic adaptor subunit [Planctomycetota bacterium]